MTDLVRRLGANGWDWVLVEPGGGGDLPAWWTVDSTPGAESVEFAGEVTITGGVTIAPSHDVWPLIIQMREESPSNPGKTYTGLRILRPGQDPEDYNLDVCTIEGDGVYLRGLPGEGDEKPVLNLWSGDSNDQTKLKNGGLYTRNSTTGTIRWETLVNEPDALAFFGADPVEKPTGVAATGPGVHAALVSLGLIAA